MTGQKDRYTTTEKLWKLDDEMLTTPKHDEMVLWLLDKKNVSKLFPKESHPCIFNGSVCSGMFVDKINQTLAKLIKNSEWITEDEIINIQSDMKFNDGIHKDSTSRFYGKDEFEGFIKKYDLDDCGFEYRLSGATYDVKIVENLFDWITSLNKSKHRDHIITEWKQLINEYNRGHDCLSSANTHIYIKSEVPITANNGFLVGYTDVVVSFEHDEYNGKILKLDSPLHPIKKYIEVKPTIKSFGQTLRQIRTYQHYMEHTPCYGGYYLFTTGNKFKKAFESQGIEVLTYPE